MGTATIFKSSLTHRKKHYCVLPICRSGSPTSWNTDVYKRQASENYQLYSEKTLEADDKAFAMKIQDTVRAVVDEVRFTRVVNMMREAKEARINTTDVPGIVKLVSKDFHITDEESSGVLQRLIEGNDLTLYGLSNAVTRHSQDVPDYDRATALEGIGYNILSMPARQWSRINQLAA